MNRFLQFVLVRLICLCCIAADGGLGSIEEPSPVLSHERISENLHYYLVKLTPENLSSWGDLKSALDREYSRVRNTYYKDNKLLPLSFIYFSQGCDRLPEELTKSPTGCRFISFMAFNELELPEGKISEKDYDQIEMLVGAHMDKELHFAVHMGIFRNPKPYIQLITEEEMAAIPEGSDHRIVGRFRKLITSDGKWEKPFHPNLSMLFHSLTAKHMLKVREILGWKEKPLKYLVTQPILKMRIALFESGIPCSWGTKESPKDISEALALSTIDTSKVSLYDPVVSRKPITKVEMDEKTGEMKETELKEKLFVLYDRDSKEPLDTVRNNSPLCWLVHVAESGSSTYTTMDYKALAGKSEELSKPFKTTSDTGE